MKKTARKVWTMNLLTDGQNPFDFCKEKSIVGIGWGLWDESTDNWEIYKMLAPKYYADNTGYQNAVKCMDEMQINDLVWVRNPNSGEYYLCEITGQMQCCYGYRYVKADICSFRSCRYYLVGSVDRLLPEIDARSLIARPTIRPVKDEQIIEATLKLFECI